ncbi:MAG: efflux RND transporter periplasmic adaptor subunit [Candidatus Zixiibacteriota bacterium]|nr:MAG: efflux RND transporter periplasmic adaptor subunit [candidate division Zixibacteria bacterium]
MTSTKLTSNRLFSFLPRNNRGLAALALVVVVAFSLGYFSSGGGDAGANHKDHTHDSENGSIVWTCSMHPQIQLPEEGKCPICFMDLIPLDKDTGDELTPRQLGMSETAMQLARIETTPVVRARAKTQLRTYGKIAYDETRVASITARVAGRLDRLFADYTGIKVKKSDKLVLIYSPELLSTQQELIQAKSALLNITENNSVLHATAVSTIEASQEKLRLYGLSPEQIERIEASGEPSEHLAITAPIGGVVVEKHVNEGMYVNVGTPLYTIADLSKLWVLFDVYESDLPLLDVGQDVKFSSPSFPGETFRAEVIFIDPVLNQITRTAKARAVVDNKGGKLKPDMLVSAVVTGASDNNRDEDETPLLIPASAPLLTGTRAVVYVDVSNNDGPLFEGREVELGLKVGEYYTVRSGLAEGEMVVTNGAFKIDSELQLRAKPSMMSPEGGGGAVGHQHDHGSTESAGTKAPAERDQRDAHAPIASDEAVMNLAPLYNAYFSVQMALASDDLAAATAGNRDIMNKNKVVDMTLFRGGVHDRWMELSKEIEKHSTAGAGAADIESSRHAFDKLSQTFIDMHKDFGHVGDADYFLTYCPMANNNNGAYWLQTVDTVYNSFYGASMLRCGEIKETLKPATDK